MWAGVNRILSDLLTVLSMLATQPGWNSHTLYKLGVLPLRIILCPEGHAGMTKHSRDCLKLCLPIFCNWLAKASSNMLFQVLLSKKSLCTGKRSVESANSWQEYSIYSNQKKESWNEMKWNEMKWASLPIETVYTLIYEFVQKSVSALV